MTNSEHLSEPMTEVLCTLKDTEKATIVRRVLLVGGSGMLGSNIVVSNSAFELYPTYLRNRIAHPKALQLDITDRANVLKRVEAIQPEVIVHAGGMTSQQPAKRCPLWPTESTWRARPTCSRRP